MRNPQADGALASGKVRDLHKRIAELEDEVARLRGENEVLSMDAVTGIPGRGVFEIALDVEFARARRFGRRLGVLMIDVDHFKRVNDEHGHRVGDDVLRHVAQAIQAQVRRPDTVARYGGEEIVALVEGLTRRQLGKLAERARVAVEGLRCPRVTVSIGTALLNDGDANGWDAVKRADIALYRAKRSGRNRVEHEEGEMT